MSILKQLKLAYNEFRGPEVRKFAQAVRSDTYLRSLDLRGNLIEQEMVDELYQAFKENESLFNFDLRENPGYHSKYARTFALKMLANYTKIGYEYQVSESPGWKNEAIFFNQKLLVVEIPTGMVDSYAKKLEQIKGN